MKYLCALTAVCVILVSLPIITVKAADTVGATFLLGLKDGSESSDGVTVTWEIEYDGETQLMYEQHWDTQKWSEPQYADFSEFGGKEVVLKLMTDPGPARNTGWDWVVIGEPKLMADDDVIYDFLEHLNDADVSMLLDGDKKETAGINFGATFQKEDATVGGETKPSIFMHPAWNGKVGNTIARWKIELPITPPQTIQPLGKLSTTWAQIKNRE